MLSILLNFNEIKIEIMNHINEIIDDINIFDFVISSFKVNLADDLLVIILLKFFSKKSNFQGFPLLIFLLLLLTEYQFFHIPMLHVLLTH
jgi:hypothetical protein